MDLLVVIIELLRLLKSYLKIDSVILNRLIERNELFLPQ